MTSKKLVISMRIVSKLKSEPTGYCIHALAIKIQSAERLEPKAMQIVTIRCVDFFRRVQPKKNKPMKVDSKKNAINPSIARGAPKMSPT